MRGSDEVKQGFIKLHRKLQDCWIWEIDKPFDERSAWIDLLLSANHTDVKIPFNGELVLVERGQFITSVRKLSEKWKWNKDKVLKFLRLLESDKMIKRDSDKFRTLITIENYDIYQDKEDTERTQDGTHQGTADGHDTDTTRTRRGHEPATNKNVKNDKNDKNDKEYNYCSEPKEDLASEQPVITLTLNDKSEYPIYQSDVDGWKALYPSVDVVQQLRYMKAWCDSNPAKRKTSRGIKRFITSWLMKEQDKGGGYSVQANNKSNGVLDKYLKGGK